MIRFPQWHAVWGLTTLMLMVLTAFQCRSAEWGSIQVPGGWAQTFANENAAQVPLTGWYRCWVRVPDSYFSRHERNLFEESVGIHIRDLQGTHECMVNGLPIGSGSSGNSQGTIFRHKIPVGTLQKGQWNEIAIKLSAPPHSGGFRNEAPFIMDYFLEAVLEGEWEFLKSDDYIPGKARSTRPQRGTFDQFRESQRVLGRTEQVHGPSLPPAESAARIESAPELKTELLLHEPEVTQPFHFTFDARGRLWVAQSRQYPYPAGVRMLSRDKYYRAQYDSIPAAPPDHTPGADRISIHEDSDGDGIFDTHKVFVDGLNLANSAIRGRGGVWVMHTPHLLFYPDANDDDIPDGPPEVRLSGFGFEDTHSISNGLTWGPDGWLYGGQGSTCSCRVTRPGIDPPDSPGVYFEGCMVWRYHPDTREFEIFAEGGGNTYGLEFDPEGRLYSGHNGGDTRGWHFVQGGFYRMQGVNPGKFGPPANPYAFGELPMMPSPDRIVRFTHFGAFAAGTAIPSGLQGMLFAIDPLHNEVIAARRDPRGSSFTTQDLGVMVKSSDPAFRPVHIANAPDGSLFVSDMYEYYIAHGQHYQNQIDPTTGRIYRIAGRDLNLEKDVNLAARTESELLKLLSHPNKWHRDTAVRLLGERSSESTLHTLREMVISESGPAAWNALWALHQAGGMDVSTAMQALRHPEAPVRLWAVRFLGDTYGIHRNLGLPGASQEARALPRSLYGTLLEQARIESNAEVRSQMASSARRLESTQGLDLTAVLMSHEEDISDPFIPLLCWWVFEAHIPSRTDEVVEWFTKQDFSASPMVTAHILPRLARRLAVDTRRHDLLLLADLFEAAPDDSYTRALLEGYGEAFRGRGITASTIPDRLAASLQNLSTASLALRLRQGEDSAFNEALTVIRSHDAPLETRISYTRTLGEMHRDEDLEFLIDLASGDGEPSLRKAAMTALGSYDDNRVADTMLELLPGLPRDLRVTALTLLCGRPQWTTRLLAAVESRILPPDLIPREIIDLLTTSSEPGISQRAAQLLKTDTPEAASRENMDTEAVLSIIQSAPGNPYDGESIYMERCGVCHRLFFKGGDVGPDLTSYQRKDLGTMLISILNPGAEIREGYQFVTIQTVNDRSLAGFQVDRDNQITVLRGLDGQDITLENTEIRSIASNGRSLMPDGLLNGLDDQEIRDLFAYLRISQPITR